MKRIYLDYAATTPTHPDVLEAMQEYFSERFGNASSLHSIGQDARKTVEKARITVAKTIGAKPEEVIFTSGGTESDNLAVKGVAFALRDQGNHIITSKIEHHAVLEPCHFLEKLGFDITFLPVDKYGMVDPDDVKKAITDKTILVSIMHANNEIGTIEPIKEISAVCRSKGVYLHTDAVQSYGSVEIDVEQLGVDLLSISAHKFYGPKGVGAIYIRKGTRITPLIHGGGQEYKKRASTHNLPGIVGLATAAQLATTEREERVKEYTSLRDRLLNLILNRIDDVKLNGHPEKRLPNNCHLIIKYVEGESMLLKLDAVGIEVATGSACSSGSLEPSHVLLAIGISPEDAHGSLRLTVGRFTTEQEIDYVAEELPRIVKELRKISPMGKNK
ncbi:MAG TPA: cysteine desulfurase NifS [candidate division WOR-3 bacterium]|uniref:Cysteine desulfurase IscS n=1 Tax=candidate division WOR-3 bacterium TaxID=2052148 RepID=A0A9C9EM22_UNCW3|nr:cysteine desulfurase NifS [candidate division WOR-3 bacterium]